jgi:hypothetical protein
MSMSNEVRSRFLEIKGRRDSDLRRLESLSSEIDSIDEGIHTKNKALATLAHIMDKKVAKDMAEMDQLVTYGLKTVFPDRDIAFRSYIKDTGKSLSIELSTLDNGEEIDDDAKGSVSVVESFILRVLCILKLKKPRVLLLDETFAAVGKEYINNVGALVSELAKKLKIDVLLVTHNPGVSDANVFRASLVNGELVLKEEK